MTGFSGAAPPPQFNMAQYVIGRAAQTSPDKVALLVVENVESAGPAETWTYRQLDRAVLARMVAGLERIVNEIAPDEGCEAEIETVWSINPIDFHPELVEFAADIVEKETGVREVMPSGPMHDSAEMARAGVPTIMMFVPSINGLSHTHIEDTAEADIELGVVAFDQLVRRMIGWTPAS